MLVHVVRTGVANLASVLAGLRRSGAEAEVTTDAEVIATARRVVLPGVGAFGAAMESLRDSGLDEVIARRVLEERPLLCVCLGLQVLAKASAESPGVAGLGVIDGRVTRFGDDVIVPQLGWNKIRPTDGCALLEPGYAYFANSYKLDAIPPGWQGATATHGGELVAAIERGPMLACQFHPELSGPWGLDLLKRWLHRADQD